MFQLFPRAYRRISATIVSVACHAAAVALLLVGAAQSNLIRPKPAKLRNFIALQIAGGSQAPRLQLPIAPFTNHQAEQAPISDPASRSISKPHEQHPPKASGTSAPAARPSDRGANSVAGNGSDAQNTTPAFPVFSPHPAVHDRSLLPASEQRVIVDVRLDAGGGVVSENLVKGIGNALDSTVMDIVKTWRFQPATVNGKPVPSEAEVIVPFNLSYPITDS